MASTHKKDKLVIPTLSVAETVITPTSSVHNIGVMFDSSMSMRDHVNSTVKAAHFHLRKIGAVRRYLTRQACEQLIHAFVTSKIDYGNALLYGVPDVHLKKLQRVLNVAARIVSLSRATEHITPVLKSLHWLPVEKRIHYKVLLLTFKALNGMAPLYLCELLEMYSPARSLRSKSQNLLVVPKTVMRTYGDRAFMCAGPRLWNTLPEYMRSISDVNVFKSKLKTYLFKQCY